MAKVNRERKFITELKKSFAMHSQTFFHKISDMPHFAGMTSRFDMEKPFDAFAIYSGMGIAIEAKSFKDYQAFGMRHLRPCQEKGLTAVHAAFGHAYVFLNVRRNSNKSLQVKRVNELYIFEWEWLFLRLSKSSIKKKELEDLPSITGKKGVFDLSGFFECLTLKK